MFSLDATLIRLSACSTLTSSFTVLADICKALPAPSVSFWRPLSPTPQPSFLSLTQSASAEAVVSPGRRLGLVAVQYLLHQLLHREARAAVPIAASPLDAMNCRGREETQSSAHQPSLPALPHPACALHPWPYLRARLHIKTTLSSKRVLREKESFFLVYFLTPDGNTESSRTNLGLLRVNFQLTWEEKHRA